MNESSNTLDNLQKTLILLVLIVCISVGATVMFCYQAHTSYITTMAKEGYEESPLIDRPGTVWKKRSEKTEKDAR